MVTKIPRRIMIANKLELDKAFKSANSLSETLQVFNTMASDSRFKSSELAPCIWSITRKLLECQPCHNPEQVFTFGKTALTILTTCDNCNIACFGLMHSKNSIDNARWHGSSLFVACVWHLLGSCCCDLKRYYESLRYLNWADMNLSALEKDYNSRCVRNCVRHVLIATEQMMYIVKVTLGKKDEAVVHAREVLKFKELMMDGECVEMGNAYVEAYKAYVGAMDAKEALSLCLKALEIYVRHYGENSWEVVLLRADLGVLYFVVGEYEKATEQNKLWRSWIRGSSSSNALYEAEIVSAAMLIDLGRSDKAIESLEVVVSRADTVAIGRASLNVMMARASCNLGNFDGAKQYISAAGRIILENCFDPIFVGIEIMKMTDLYEKMEDFATAVSLLKRVLNKHEWYKTIFENSLENRRHEQRYLEGIMKILVKLNLLLAKCSTSLFSLISLAGREKEEITYMMNVIEKVEKSVGEEHIEVGYCRAKLGAALINSGQEDLAVQSIEKAKDIMSVYLGPHHMDSLRISHTLAETYEKLGRFNRAIEIQQGVVECLEGLGPSEQQFMDKAVRLLNKMKEHVSERPTTASSRSQDGKDLSAQMSTCGI